MTKHLPTETYKQARGEWMAIIQDLRDRGAVVWQDPVTENVLIEIEEEQLASLWQITRTKVLELPAPPEYKL